MATFTDGILAYGFDLGSSRDDWETEPDWVTDSGDLETDAEAKLLAAAGTFGSEARDLAGVTLRVYCSETYPMHILSAHSIKVARGHVQAIDFAALDAQRAAEGWDGKLRAALEVLGVTSKQTEPQWLLASYWW